MSNEMFDFQYKSPAVPKQRYNAHHFYALIGALLVVSLYLPIWPQTYRYCYLDMGMVIDNEGGRHPVDNEIAKKMIEACPPFKTRRTWFFDCDYFRPDQNHETYDLLR